MGRWTRARLIHLAIGLALAALPFTLVTFPPSADLAQHAAQVRLLEEQLGLKPETTPHAQYEVRWLAPNTLVYALFFATARVLPPVEAARLGLAILALALVASIHELARRRDRPPEHATLAGTLVFSLSLYWGFVSFLAGAAILLLALDRAMRAPVPGETIRDVAVLAVLVALLYQAHSLWLPVLAVALAIAPLIERRPLRREMPRAIAFLPVIAHAAVWFPRLDAERAAGGFDVAARWEPLAERLDPAWLPDVLFGGLKGPIEPCMAVLLAAWAVTGLATPRRSERGGVDRLLLVLAGLLGAFVLAGPAKYVNTILFNERFAFVAGILVLLAAPRPPFRAGLAHASAVLAAVAFAALTGAAWIGVDRGELAGLEPSLRAAPGPARVVGLDFVRQSDTLKGTPFLQAFAWRQAIYGGYLNFSFAEHRSGIVGFRARRRTPWTAGLDWDAGWVTRGDLLHFDLALVGAGDDKHERFARWSGAQSLVDRGRFRLYRLPTGRAPGSDVPWRDDRLPDAARIGE